MEELAIQFEPIETIISPEAIDRRNYWINEIQKLSGNFGEDTDKLQKELEAEIGENPEILIDHLRLCGSIPESYAHDSTEEKLYSKYTDTLLSIAYNFIGLKSEVLTERADSADVDVEAPNYSFVADAKAFRLSRTAKNQKDFKVQAMDGWKKGKPYAMVVCPIYQLPSTSSQIYEQSINRNVLIFTYSHMALLVRFYTIEGSQRTIELIKAIFDSISTLKPSKEAVLYWKKINQTILGYSPNIAEIWQTEKVASAESVLIARQEVISYLTSLKAKINSMSHEEAIRALLMNYKIESKTKTINSVVDNGIFELK